MTVTMDDELEAVLAHDAIEPLFQPIVDLADREVVAYEALARGPVDSPLHMPDALFSTARAAHRLTDLDELCRRRALESALASELRGPTALFVNVEPETLSGVGPVAPLVMARRRGLRLVAELTERALTRDPAALLSFAGWVRAAGGAIALDDVGAEPESLALMPFLRPEVVKLDLRLVQCRPDAAVAEIMTAVNAYAEQSGALVLAEGIEDETHLQTALSLGATLGQGWYFGRPGPLSTAPAPRGPRRRRWIRPRREQPSYRSPATRAAERADRALGILDPARAPLPPTSDSPFEAVATVRPPLRGGRPLLLAVSTHLEEQAAGLGEAAVVLASFERASTFTPGTARRYRRLAASAAFVAVLGHGMTAEPVRGVRGASLPPGDPMLVEWNVVVVGPHFAAALVAREVEPGSTSRERPFDYALTYDRRLVLDVARSMMTRVVPVPAPTVADLAAMGLDTPALSYG